MIKNQTLSGAVLTLCVFLAACGQTESKAKQSTKVDQKPAELIEVNAIVPGTLFATFDPQFGFESMQAAAKRSCKNEEICKVIIFKVGTVLPTKFPMTEREANEEIGNFTLNRNSGADELVASCAAVKDTPKSQCMSVN